MSNPFEGLTVAGVKAKSNIVPTGARPIDLSLAGVTHRTRGVGNWTFTGQVADGETVTLTLADGTAIVFEFDDNSSVAAGNVAVDITGNASAADDVADLNAALLAVGGGVTGMQPYARSATQYLIAAGPLGAGATLTDAATNVASESMKGDVPHGSPQVLVANRTPTAQEVTDGVLLIAADFLITGFSITVKTGATVKAWDGATLIELGAVLSLDNAGAVDWTTGDTITALIYGTNVDWETKVVFD